MDDLIPAPDLDALLARLRSRADTLRNQDARARRAALQRFKKVLLAQRESIQKALWEDIRKPAEETDLTELTVTLAEINHAERHVSQWMKPKRLPTPLPLLGTSARQYLEPHGVVLLIAPWNYPLMLALTPLALAVAAGNTVVLKPSEMTPATSACIAHIIQEVFADDEVAVVQGGAETAQALLNQRFDHIYFTGSPAVGRLVMEAAARHLTSVTLELGGKSPAIVDASADVPLAARRLVFGKFSNAGQTCIAPDYVLVERRVYPALLEELQRQIKIQYRGDPDAGCGLVHARHLIRLQEMLQEAVAAGARIVHGGTSGAGDTPDTCRMVPTVVADAPPGCRLLREEIFGPILPIVPYDTLEDALAFSGSLPPALTLYLFTTDPKTSRAVRERTTTGSILVNDTLLHFGHPEMAFGGIHESGVGRGHGYAGFLAFSNVRPVLRQHAGAWSLFDKLYPPYTRTARFLQDVLLWWYGR